MEIVKRVDLGVAYAIAYDQTQPYNSHNFKARRLYKRRGFFLGRKPYEGSQPIETADEPTKNEKT